MAIKVIAVPIPVRFQVQVYGKVNMDDGFGIQMASSIILRVDFSGGFYQPLIPRKASGFKGPGFCCPCKELKRKVCKGKALTSSV
jgi:hypothetical protein